MLLTQTKQIIIEKDLLAIKGLVVNYDKCEN